MCLQESLASQSWLPLAVVQQLQKVGQRTAHAPSRERVRCARVLVGPKKPAAGATAQVQAYLSAKKNQNVDLQLHANQ